MRISLNPSHVKLWGRYAYYFALYLVGCFLFGPHARPDEVLFVVTLPLWFLVPYIVFCFMSALIKSWLIRHHRGLGGVEVGFMPDVRIQQRGRAPDHRFAHKVSRVRPRRMKGLRSS